MAFESLQEMIDLTIKKQLPLYKVILLDDAEEGKISPEVTYEQMRGIWGAIKEASDGYEEKLKSSSGLVGGDGAKLVRFHETHEKICGDYMSLVCEEALKMSESNACMKRIVAAPTAGSCGVIPAVFVPFQKLYHKSDEEMIEAMFVAAGIGQVIATRSSISGARGGCQAEIGSASSMAAGALCYLRGGDVNAVMHAAAMALKSLLGLVCDPVAGLVEVPCVKRNVIGAVNAITSAELALAGITSKIPPDQVIDAMKEIGDKIDVSLKETALGGLANTPFAVEFAEKLGG